ncbi:MAG: hypothetical protein CFE21_02205 [Bacteroidetes bacterium B1(2017)]|nr:MAG: hypothetical protein CFE21_02205 [Bacteroidetes bacterium B1(2017)]
MNQGKDIIILSVIRWDQPMAGSSIAMAKELSRTHRVFFIDRPFSIKDLFKDYENFSLRKRLSAILFRKDPFMKVETGYSNFIVATPGLTLPINFLPKGFVFDFFNYFNSLIVKACVKRMAKKFQITEFIYLNIFYPTILPTLNLRASNNLINIYYVTHDIKLSKYMMRHGELAEEKLLQKTDLVLVNSKHQFKRLFNQMPRMHYFPSAVDFDLFKKANDTPIAKPYDLLNIGQTKVIMFCGYLSDIRIDYKLLKLVCENHPHYLVVIIGTYEESDLIHYKLDTLPNLIILGNRRYESIPSYLKCAHVTIIPYLCNELNKSVYPLKLNEYLAMGKPVVTTHFSADLDSFADVIYISDNYEAFLNNIELAMNETNTQLPITRIKVAEKNNWEHRVTHLNHLIDQFIEDKK